jgi:predicted ATPase
MKFTVLARRKAPPRGSINEVFLIDDNWNDYSYYTLFGIFYIDQEGAKHDLGAIKLAFYGQETGKSSLQIGHTFNINIGPSHFSIGVDTEYYVKLNNLGPQIRDAILLGLNDIAKNPNLLDKAEHEQVYKISFLRGLSQTTIEGQFGRLAMGSARLTPYHFTYTTPSVNSVTTMTLNFDVQPFSKPPTNIHVLIGRNGVGKTFLINNMIDSLMKDPKSTGKFGLFQSVEDEPSDSDDRLFANLICVTFSAFDDFEHPPEKKDKSKGLQYSYIGLKTIQGDGTASEIIDPTTIPTEFLKSIKTCRGLTRSSRWRSTIEMLYSDPMFKSAEVADLIDSKTDIQLEKNAERLFKKLSTGHKLILLTITRLVEKLEERSLVLIDEPETHLHPPLLSSFMRALTDLLIDRNAVSIIATHSPVILQEVPKNCVWKLRRSGTEALAERLLIEPFGENVGILTQEVFGLEVTDSGFHKILKQLVETCPDYDSALREMNNQLGLEARAILRVLYFQKDKENAPDQ